MERKNRFGWTRRELIKMGILAGGPTVFGSRSLLPTRAYGELYLETFPTSPLVLNPLNDPLPIPKAPAPLSEVAAWRSPPGRGVGRQDSGGGTAGSGRARWGSRIRSSTRSSCR